MSNLNVNNITPLSGNSGTTSVSGSLFILNSTSGSFSGSFSGDGTNITGVTGEWDGSLNGNASITGSLIVSSSLLTFDGTVIDIDASGAITIDSVGLSIDNAGTATNITSTSDGAGEDFTIALAGATDSSLVLSSTGTAADALKIATSAGGMDITVAGAAANEDLDITSNSSINITATENAANAVYLRANGGTSETLKIHSDQGTGAGSIEITSDAGGIDMNAAGAATLDAVGVAIGAGSGELDLTTTGTMDLNSAALDIDTSGTVTIDAAGVASNISIVTAHTAGDAFHLDANADAGSIVKVDAGILDLNVTAAATLDAVGIALGAGSGELDLTTTGTMDINSAALDIDTSGAITIDAAGVASDISIVTAHTAGVAFHLDADANAGSIVDIDAGILDIDVTGAATIDAATLVVSGIRNKNVVAQSGTGAEDLTAVAQDLIWYAATTQAGAITLPQASADNVGMKIKIIAGATWSTTPFKLGFASGGSTVMTGKIQVSALDAVLTTTFPVTANAKNLVIDADAVATAGGAVGSVYEFTYLAANLVICEANAFITTGTVATTAAASVTGGI